MAEKSEVKYETTEPNTELDLERRLADGFEADSVVSGTVVVNPNPFGEEDYAGTDPIYQNHANDTEKPHRAKKGAEKKAEDQLRKAHAFGKGDDVVADPGLGGKAVRTHVETPVQSMNVADHDKASKSKSKVEEPVTVSPPSPTV